MKLSNIENKGTALHTPGKNQTDAEESFSTVEGTDEAFIEIIVEQTVHSDTHGCFGLA